MSLSLRISTATVQLALVLALSAPISMVSAQAPAAGAASKPKTKLVPRPLPGSGSPSFQTGPSAGELESADATARAKVPLYRPASVQRSGAPTMQTGAGQQAEPQYSDRARIVAIRRRGTFPIPASTHTASAPVLVNETSPTPVAANPEPAALPPGKIRVIPKDMIKVGTPAAQP